MQVRIRGSARGAQVATTSSVLVNVLWQESEQPWAQKDGEGFGPRQDPDNS